MVIVALNIYEFRKFISKHYFHGLRVGSELTIWSFLVKIQTKIDSTINLRIFFSESNGNPASSCKINRFFVSPNT